MSKSRAKDVFGRERCESKVRPTFEPKSTFETPYFAANVKDALGFEVETVEPTYSRTSAPPDSAEI